MDATNQQSADKTDVAEDPMFDLDRLLGLARAASACLHENRKLRGSGQPTKSTEPLEEYLKAAAPNVVLLALDRLAVAGALLEAVKGGVTDQAMRKRVDVFLTGVLTEADLMRAWPHYAAELAADAAQAEGAQHEGA